MEAQHPEDFRILRNAFMKLNAEVARISTVVAGLKADRASPVVSLADRQCGPDRQLDVPTQQTVIEVPDITTVEVRLPGGTSRFFHKCFMCKERFQSSVRRPKQCPRCGSHRWPDGRTKWDRRKDDPME